ncbi:hypothetical protein [Wolinella succinogenes]|uniref:Uncharacterized protein n=1 Tax=Wolinella succinogenes (strain ATCC 29543 / DSM 1740 / CCUG 13145 / JCM 31913 / LMG 7466 / NCTC 11488 / FDC 602W) TaxID=273121 RepID=Q7MRU4_WOLSU|nr:hypothetical protein [Wolinella succinogenes]CAE10139.1 hypothetical protein WS1039 [Wolinella succinogenes]VEG82347.1 Uncharacterised protein [Wolinella succinogenes]
MIEQIIKDRKFKNLMEAHAKAVIEYLLSKQITFSILCNVGLVEFNPPLPESITSSFRPLTLFVLAGYTFESIELDHHNLYFEAGFGAQNLGSFVTVPLYSILQIILQDSNNIQDSTLFVNLTAGNDSFEVNLEDEEGVKSSMEALLSNPENQRFKK